MEPPRVCSSCHGFHNLSAPIPFQIPLRLPTFGCREMEGEGAGSRRRRGRGNARFKGGGQGWYLEPCHLDSVCSLLFLFLADWSQVHESEQLMLHKTFLRLGKGVDQDGNGERKRGKRVWIVTMSGRIHKTNICFISGFHNTEVLNTKYTLEFHTYANTSLHANTHVLPHSLTLLDFWN